MGRADVLRRAMGKKKKEVLEQEFDGFRSGMTAHGFSDEAVQALWDTVLPFAGYAFNKSHAAGYALVGYWTAYLKAHRPVEYMAALLTSVGDNKDKSAVYLAECRRLGIRVLPPDVNESAPRFAAVGDDIRFGLEAVRNVGGGVVQSIIRTREEQGRYASFRDFVERSELVACAKRVLESLAKAGGFDSLGETRLGVVRVHEAAVDAVVPLKRRAAAGQFDLFGEPGAAEPGASPLAHLEPGAEEYSRAELLAHEREMLGLYVSAHPLDGAEGLLRRHAPRPIAALLAEQPRDGEVVVAGLVTGVERRIDKRGEPWAICTLEDFEASIEVLFFAKAYAASGADLLEDTAVAVRGRVNRREDRLSVFGDGLVVLDLATAGTDAAADALVLCCAPGRLDADTVDELRRSLEAHPGDTPVHVRLDAARGPRFFALDRYPVEVTPMLLGELKGIRGIGVVREAG
jgi:DNA polymerase-3 subunit alpha